MDTSNVLADSEKAIAELKKQIGRSTAFAVGAIGLTLFFYIVNFVARGNIGLSPDPEQWGQFGDFVGGVLNPAMALLAFYWLTRSVLFQKEEMQKTASALVDAAKHQERQAEQAERTARINALAALLSSADAEVQYHMTRIQAHDEDVRASRAATDLAGRRLSTDERLIYRQGIGVDLGEAIGRRTGLAAQLSAALLASQEAELQAVRSEQEA